MYAGIQAGGEKCFCGSSYGKYGLGKCHSGCKRNFAENCGGNEANAVFNTRVTVPGPPLNLKMDNSMTNKMSISWEKPEGAPENGDLIKEYSITATIQKSFDVRVS